MAVNKLDISMMEDVGTSANQLVQRDGSGNLPAIDGSQLTNVDGGFTQSASSPATNTNPSGGVGTVWYNTTTGNGYVCTNATTNSNVWRNFGLGIRPIPIWFGGRGCFGAGNLSGGSNAHSVTIDYVTIATPGNATDFGDLIRNGENVTSSVSNGSRGIWAGGSWRDSANNTAYNNEIQYITIANTGNATDFGDLVRAGSSHGACSDETRGIWAARNVGGTEYNEMDFVTLATTGNANDFGNLTSARNHACSCSNGITGVWAGGGNFSNIIDCVRIATIGNATDFGDLTVARVGFGACSGD